MGWTSTRSSLAATALSLGLASVAMAQSSEGGGVEAAPGLVDYVAERLDEVKLRIAERPTADALLKAGLSSNNDFAERSDAAGFVAPSIGQAGELGKRSALDLARDPAVSLGIEQGLAEKLGREPLPEEIDDAVARFDARIAAVNERLAANHEERATAYRKTGLVPEQLEREALEPFAMDTVAGPGDAGRKGVDPELEVRLRFDWITAQINQALDRRDDASAQTK